MIQNPNSMRKSTARMMRVAMVVFAYYPADIRVRREAEALVEAGISVDIFCLKGKSEARKEIVDGVQVYRFPLRRKRSRKLRYMWEYCCFISLSFLFLSILFIYKRYKIIHVHNMPDFLVFSSFLPRLCGSKLILDLHDPMPEVYMAKYSIKSSHLIISLLIFLEKLSIWFSDFVITPNIAFRNLFISRGCPKSKIQIVMNSPDEKIFSCSWREYEKKKIDNDEFRIMYHGTITERNGLDLAVEALNMLRNKIPNISFHVYGEGDFVEYFLKLVKKLNLDDIVHYHGQVAPETIAREIELIDVGLIPNKKNPFTNINMPTRIFEYLCKGKPVIVPRTKGILDYFDEESLCFFEPGSVDKLAEKIIDVYNNPARCHDILARGISVYKKYRWELQRQHLLKLVTRLLGLETRQNKKV